MADFVLVHPGSFAIEKFIHQENLALFRKRLAEPHSDAEHKVLLKLLAEEEARDLPQGQAHCQRHELSQGQDFPQGKTHSDGARDQF